MVKHNLVGWNQESSVIYPKPFRTRPPTSRHLAFQTPAKTGKGQKKLRRKLHKSPPNDDVTSGSNDSYTYSGSYHSNIDEFNLPFLVEDPLLLEYEPHNGSNQTLETIRSSADTSKSIGNGPLKELNVNLHSSSPKGLTYYLEDEDNNHSIGKSNYGIGIEKEIHISGSPTPDIPHYAIEDDDNEPSVVQIKSEMFNAETYRPDPNMDVSFSDTTSPRADHRMDISDTTSPIADHRMDISDTTSPKADHHMDISNSDTTRPRAVEPYPTAFGELKNADETLQQIARLIAPHFQQCNSDLDDTLAGHIIQLLDEIKILLERMPGEIAESLQSVVQSSISDLLANEGNLGSEGKESHAKRDVCLSIRMGKIDINWPGGDADTMTVEGTLMSLSELFEFDPHSFDRTLLVKRFGEEDFLPINNDDEYRAIIKKYCCEAPKGRQVYLPVMIV